MTQGKRKPIVAIDGPSGAGKSSVSRRVAQILGFTYIDTGAMYRCIGHLAARAGLACEPSSGLLALLDELEIRFEGPAERQRVICNGEDLTAKIREHSVSEWASRFSALQPVRERLISIQREMGGAGGVVMEGRDIGTNVFPDAEVKVFLDASAEVRARRRFEELVEKGESVTFEKILADQLQRDRQDETRILNPLRKARDAAVVDSSGLDIDRVVEIICNLVKKKQ